MCDRYFLLSGKVLLSLLSSSRLLTFSLFIYAGFSLSERRGSSSDAGSHPLLSDFSHTELHGETQDAWRRALQNKTSTHARKRQLYGCVIADCVLKPIQARSAVICDPSSV